MNTELKQYVFAGYIGQKVMISSKLKGVRDINYFNLSFVDDKHIKPQLILRPLSAITDSEAVEVAKISYPDYYPNEKEVIRMGKSIVYDLKSELGLGSISWVKAMSLYQYLQQQGFALPVWFKGEFYSVERLVNEEKIIKLTE